MSPPRDEPAGDSRGALRGGAGRIPEQTTAPGAAEATPLPGAVARPAARPSPSPRARAGVVTRLTAAAVDVGAVVLLAVLLDLGLAGLRFAWSPVDFSWPTPELFLTLFAHTVLAFLYLTVGWALAGRTYGARLLGLRVLSTRLELLGWFRAALRALVCVLFPVGLLWCGVSRTRSSVADLLLRTVVVYDTRPYASLRAGLTAGPAGAAPPAPDPTGPARQRTAPAGQPAPDAAS